jgi:hypothetical protein
VALTGSFVSTRPPPLQHVRTLLQPGAPYQREKNGKHAFSVEAATAVCFLEDFARYGHLSRDTLQMYLPPFLMDHRDS